MQQTSAKLPARQACVELLCEPESIEVMRVELMERAWSHLPMEMESFVGRIKSASVARLCLRFGEGNAAMVIANIIQRMNELLGLRVAMTKAQVVFLSKSIVAEFRSYGLTVLMLWVFVHRIAGGKEIKMYDRLTPPSFLQGLREFVAKWQELGYQQSLEKERVEMMKIDRPYGGRDSKSKINEVRKHSERIASAARELRRSTPTKRGVRNEA